MPTRIARYHDPRLLSVLAVAAACIAARLLGTELPSLDLLGAGMLLLGSLGRCEAIDGPVVRLARKALETGNVNRVLPWVRPEHEAVVREAFERARAERSAGPDARAIADLRFFEAVVRAHRTGEGEPYTGLKPAGHDTGPAVQAADRALASDDPASLVELLTKAVREGLRWRFQAVSQHRRFDVNDVAEARRYVEAYVPLIEYVETIWNGATEGAPQRQGPGAAAPAEPRELRLH